MQSVINEARKIKTLKDAMVSIPKTITANKIFQDSDFDKIYCAEASYSNLVEMWNQQHPLIHTWLILAPISICFLFVLLFIIH